MVPFDGNQWIAQVQTMASMCTLDEENAIQLIYTPSPYQLRKKQQQNVQPTLKFFPSDVTIYLPFNFLQLFFAFAVKVNSMGLLTEFFMIHNFSFSFFSIVGSRFFRFTFDDIFIGFLFIFVFASSLVQPFTIS